MKTKGDFMRMVLVFLVCVLRMYASVPNAGPDQEFVLPSFGNDVTVFLNGSNSGNLENYTWSQKYGPLISITNGNTLTPTFVIDGSRADRIGAYTFELTAGGNTDSVNIIAHGSDEHVPEIYPSVTLSGTDINGGNVHTERQISLIAGTDNGQDTEQTVTVQWNQLTTISMTTSLSTTNVVDDTLNLYISGNVGDVVQYELKAYDGLLTGPPLNVSFTIVDGSTSTVSDFNVGDQEVEVEELEPNPSEGVFKGGGGGGCLLRR